MADDSLKPASRGGASRLRVAGRLTALAGLPLLIIFSIFAGGVYCGASRSYRVQTLEARWLGFEAHAADRDADPGGPDLVAPDQVGDQVGDGGSDAGAPEQAEPEQPLAVGTDSAGGPGTAQPQTPPQPEQAEPDTPEPTQPATQASGLLTATSDPVGSELRTRFDESRVMRVKILVDPALVIAREDWLSYVANLIEATHASFELLFGVEVQLQGVVIWDMATGADEDRLLTDLTDHEREGADVILGLIARPRPQDFDPTRWVDDVHGDHALVFADLTQTDRFYRNLLRELAGLLGAEPATDPASTQLGSFMSDAAPPPGTPPRLDPDNRGKVIFNKRRPFATAATHAEAPEQDEPKPKQPNPDTPPQPEPNQPDPNQPEPNQPEPTEQP